MFFFGGPGRFLSSGPSGQRWMMVDDLNRFEVWRIDGQLLRCSSQSVGQVVLWRKKKQWCHKVSMWWTKYHPGITPHAYLMFGQLLADESRALQKLVLPVPGESKTNQRLALDDPSKWCRAICQSRWSYSAKLSLPLRNVFTRILANRHLVLRPIAWAYGTSPALQTSWV